jgi:hypothetical protein
MRALESFEPAEVPVTAAAARKRKRKSTTKKLFAAAPDVLLQAIASGAAERVNFYGRGVLNSSNIEASMQQYHDEWPVREWAPRGEAKVVRSKNPNLFVVYQPFSWTVSDGSHNAHGDATLYLRIRKNSQGEFRIVHVHQLDR